MANINISINTVRQALADLMTDGTINQAGYDTIHWYYTHCREQGYSQKQASVKIGKTWTTLWRVWNGTYGAGYDAIIKEINKFKSLYEKRARLAAVDYIKTSIYETVRDVCDNALIGQEISTIYGNTQIGKSSAIRQYIKTHPDTRIVSFEMPSCPCKSLFFAELANACHVTYDSKTNTLRKYIKQAVDSKTLIIIDEFHEVFLGSENSAIAIVEFVRELYNYSQCGVVLVGTDVMEDHMEKRKHKGIYAQTLKRGLIHAQLPDKTPAADISKAAAKYGYPEKITQQARKLIDQINVDHGLGVILKNLKAGATLAKKRNQAPTWDHLIEAWTILQRLSRKTKGDE